MKKLFLLLALLSVSLLFLIGCSDPTWESSGTSDTESIESTAPDTTASVTTVNYEALRDNNPYADAALELTLKVCEQYYNLKSHTLATSLTDRNTTTVWPVAAYIEMLAEAYRMYPENETVKKYYTDILDRGLLAYMVTNATITPPSGDIYTGITYFNAGPNWQGDFYYDDNAWICIQLLDAYKLLGKKTYLNWAERILEFLWTGWDERAGGGIYWDKTFSGKGICTNGPATIAFCVGYQLTGKEEYLTRAEMIYEWCNRLTRGSDGIYNAGIKNFGIVSYDPTNLDPWRAAYDQGTMMCAASLLHEITKKEDYKNDLRITAISSRTLMFSGNEMNRNPIFKSWCVGWMVRGELTAYQTGHKAPCNNFMRNLDIVLKKTLKTKDENGHYDPFFCSPGTDFWEEDYFDSDVLQASGVATVLFLTARYQVYMTN